MASIWRTTLIGASLCGAGLATRPQPAPEGDLGGAAIAARTIVEEALWAPAEARFRNMAWSPQQHALCGEVNALNRDGRYVGFRRFISFETAGYLLEGGSLQSVNLHSIRPLPRWVSEAFGFSALGAQQAAREDAFRYLWVEVCD